ncbi:MAG: HEAT repeat domain-containing protein, partial [Spirulina sp.]
MPETKTNIDPDNANAIASLLHLLETAKDGSTREYAVESLGKIGQGNAEAIAGLLEILATSENYCSHQLAIEGLGKIG